jgi:hypothetical protein
MQSPIRTIGRLSKYLPAILIGLALLAGCSGSRLSGTYSSLSGRTLEIHGSEFQLMVPMMGKIEGAVHEDGNKVDFTPTKDPSGAAGFVLHDPELSSDGQTLFLSGEAYTRH